MTVLNNQISRSVCVAGVGHHLPERFEDNEELCQKLTVDPSWILDKTGIKRRYLAGPEDTTTGFATLAAKRALADANIMPDLIDLIIVCTFSGDYIFPPVSAKVQANLVAKNAQIFDLQANCCGFVTGLTVASDRMKVDSDVRNALVIGVEMNSRYIDRSDMNTSIYMSDGASAVVLTRTPRERGILGSYFYTDSSNYEAVRMRGGGSSFRSAERQFDPLEDYMEMNGIATWKQAITHLPKVIRKACEKSQVNLIDVDFLIFHQANLNMIEYIVRKLGFDMSKTYTNVQEIGNTGSASVGIALSECVAKCLIKDGQIVVLAAVGAGFNFGASVWRWETKK
jgi:3-oxoacyl-[acyl-carrier-protein] synthase-3